MKKNKIGFFKALFKALCYIYFFKRKIFKGNLRNKILKFSKLKNSPDIQSPKFFKMVDYDRLNYELDVDPTEMFELCRNAYNQSPAVLESWFRQHANKLIPPTPINSTDDFNTLCFKTIRVIFARISLMLVDNIANKKEFVLLTQYLFEFLLRAKETGDEVEMLFLFNCTKGIIDSNDSLQRLLSYFIHYSKISTFTAPKLTNADKKIVDDAFAFFKEVITREEVKKALDEVETPKKNKSNKAKKEKKEEVQEENKV